MFIFVKYDEMLRQSFPKKSCILKIRLDICSGCVLLRVL